MDLGEIVTLFLGYRFPGSRVEGARLETQAAGVQITDTYIAGIC